MTRAELLRKASPAEILEWQLHFELDAEARLQARLAADAERELQQMKRGSNV